MLNEGLINNLERCKRAVDVVLNKVRSCDIDLDTPCFYLIKHTLDNMRDIYNEVEKRENKASFDALVK
jgi:hypothetical protein